MPTADDHWILTLNAGSSSLKYAAFAMHGEGVLTSGQVAGIGLDARFLGPDGMATPVNAQDHSAALGLVLRALEKLGLDTPDAVGHRIVHGGEQTRSAIITDEIFTVITDAATLAPLHDPPAIKVIEAVRAKHPLLKQVACFDTAFHAENPPEATVIPIPEPLRAKGIRRYGFHGLSYASIVRRFEVVTGAPLPRRLLACHLGAGASLAAIKDGRGVATTMGFSPMDGLVMATRAGEMDSGVLIHLMRTEGMDADRLEHLLNYESGLKATGGTSNMKELLATDTPEAAFAVTHFCYWAARHAGAMIAALGGLDGVVFSGGIGENASQIRTNIVSRLTWAGQSDAATWVVPADEEGEIAHAVRQVCAPS